MAICATYRIVDEVYAQLMALFAVWRVDIDSEPFAHEDEFQTLQPAFPLQRQPLRIELGPPDQPTRRSRISPIIVEDDIGA